MREQKRDVRRRRGSTEESHRWPLPFSKDQSTHGLSANRN